MLSGLTEKSGRHRFAGFTRSQIHTYTYKQKAIVRYVMNKNNHSIHFDHLLRRRPDAWAIMRGDKHHSKLFGTVRFYDHIHSTLVVAEVHGLPDTESRCKEPIFAFHIHEGNHCTGNTEDAFANVGMHYNPYNCPHPYHVGDMPPLFGVNGSAVLAFLTDRFTVYEIIGRTVIIHASPDDFSTQPSGNTGMKIACGEIVGQHQRRNEPANDLR